MKKRDRFLKFFYFNFCNWVVRKGEHGGFKWTFRRFWLDIETVSGNFKCRFMADEHPYGYLLVGESDENIIGFCQGLYILGKSLTSDQALVNDVSRAIKKYENRKVAVPAEDKQEEAAIIEMERAEAEFAALPKKEQRRRSREIDKRFKKTVKSLSKNNGEGNI